ncbi:hypothetical protein WR25_03721 [Diploscapter pachys]|uniref:Uncharacterized protein n=1 Tax=Diploscapter pachys TaxID=2018661 RepID=A0A2A2LP02_9BILA|nr:hypothetical protein WR25_03721 [Diploscapter pachys]
MWQHILVVASLFLISQSVSAKKGAISDLEEDVNLEELLNEIRQTLLSEDQTLGSKSSSRATALESLASLEALLNPKTPEAVGVRNFFGGFDKPKHGLNAKREGSRTSLSTTLEPMNSTKKGPLRPDTKIVHDDEMHHEKSKFGSMDFSKSEEIDREKKNVEESSGDKETKANTVGEGIITIDDIKDPNFDVQKFKWKQYGLNLEGPNFGYFRSLGGGYLNPYSYDPHLVAWHTYKHENDLIRLDAIESICKFILQPRLSYSLFHYKSTPKQPL